MSQHFFSSTLDNDLLSSANDMFAATVGESVKPVWQRRQQKQSKILQQRRSISPDSNSNSNSSAEQKDFPNGDRFIPLRTHNISDKAQIFTMDECEEKKQGTPEKKFDDCLRSTLLDSTIDDPKILTYKEKAPAPDAGHLSHMRVFYTVPASSLNDKRGSDPMIKNNSRRKLRHVAETAERILDAPDLKNNFYLNLLHWSCKNVVAIGLGNCAYLWDAASGQIELLTEMPGDNYITSVNWTHTGTHLAIGTNDAVVSLWDAKQQKRVRKLTGHSSRVGSLAWNNFILSTGSSDGTIMNHDVRVKEHHISTFKGHEQEVCGLRWNNNAQGTRLASGGNDNLVCIWDHDHTASESLPRHTLSEARSAVKALAWCPWQEHLLATGGGTGDGHIRFYDVTTGNCINQVNTESQICSLAWNPFEKEILSAHGFTKNQLSIWRYPSMTRTHDLTGHTSRVLHTALSPDGTMVCSAAADETLRFWKVFEKPKETVRENCRPKRVTNSLNLNIR